MLANTTATFQIPALDCAEELALIEKGLRPLEGIGELSPDYLNRRLRVAFDPTRQNEDAIAERLAAIGFPAEASQANAKRTGDAPAWPRPSTLVGAALLMLAIALRFALGATTWPVAALCIAATAVSGWPVVLAGWRAARLLALDMHALVTIAVTGAIATGDYFEAATAMVLFAISLWLESYSLGRARRAVQSLVEWNPTVAHHLCDHGLHDVDPSRLVIGDRVLVKPGERVPVDGVVLEGSSTVNQAPITGESLPIEKAVGDEVFAGTLNVDGSLEVEATRTAQESTLAHISRLVELAQATRSPTQRLVDTFARRYTPAVIVIAVLLATVPPLLFQEPFLDWLHRGLVLLVIACPCALVISTPVAIVCALHAAARRGMLVKGGQHLEAAGQIDAVTFDKTGTLTTGQMQVTGVIPIDAANEAEVLGLAAALEAQSEHPLARAIVDEARCRGFVVSKATEFSALRGFGVRALVHEEMVAVGSPRMFREQGFGGDEAKLARALAAAKLHGGATPALVGTRDRLLGAIILADQPRRDAAAAVDELHRLGVRPVVMLTGDGPAAAQAIGAATGVDETHAELLPQDKVNRVAELARRYPNLAMVGDGVNDAPALAAARLGIALGSQASDTAMETADVVILSPHVARVPELVRLGRRLRRVLVQNIALALAIKLVVLALAAAGIATMWAAVAADVGASLLVIANGMRLLRP